MALAPPNPARSPRTPAAPSPTRTRYWRRCPGTALLCPRQRTTRTPRSQRISRADKHLLQFFLTFGVIRERGRTHELCIHPQLVEVSGRALRVYGIARGAVA